MSTLPDLITVLGPTAGGKTAFAAHLAKKLKAEIISADSRQVYRGMDLGTGKDYADYEVEGSRIPCHLMDIHNAGYKYNVYEYQADFLRVYQDLKKKDVMPVLCGGSGMYLEAVLEGYRLIQVPVNLERRKDLEGKSDEDLINWFKSLKKPHNSSDTSTRKRLIRAIEIAEYYQDQEIDEDDFPKIKSLIMGVRFDRRSQRERITQRLKQRLDEGMIEEVKKLLEKVTAENLIYYGLEYKFITLYLTGELSYNEMFKQLNTAIHQFAKRQMTWFRRMEKKGHKIHWLDGYMPMEEKISRTLDIIAASGQ